MREKSPVKLDLFDRKILIELDKNCRQSDARIGKKVGRSRESVRYRIKRLQEKGVIDGFLTTINPNKFGYHLFKIFIQVENIEEEREKLVNYLKQNESIFWMGLAEGAWDMVFATYAKDQVEFYDIKNDLLTRFNHIIVKMATGELVDVRQYIKNYLLADRHMTITGWDTSFLWGGVTEYHDLDDTDKNIIKLLSNDARIPVSELAKITGMTDSIVRSKMRRLEELDIVQAYRISIDLNKLGLEFFKAIIYLKQLPEERMRAFYEYVKLHPKIIYFLRTFTPWEIELEMVVESYLEFNDIIKEMRSEFSDIIKNYELIIMYWEAWFPAYRKVFE